ncbi:MAG: hypothetical protein R2711_11230 [Acidimicrobiales bacterium]
MPLGGWSPSSPAARSATRWRLAGCWCGSRPRPWTSSTAAGWAPGGLIAYSKVCTHAGCPVGLYQAESRTSCARATSPSSTCCRAEPLTGPAAWPLPQLPIEIGEDGVLRSTGDFGAGGPGVVGGGRLVTGDAPAPLDPTASCRLAGLLDRRPVRRRLSTFGRRAVITYGAGRSADGRGGWDAGAETTAATPAPP